ncbi:MAG: ASCH domain-containing protein [Clostridia bacterium]|jgi:hypothetical protein|nr:ASCH domain-containing protein [Clostridia bacterium]
MLKVLTIIEPWATLIAKKKKFIETRSWKTSYRGELYIHASKKKIDMKYPAMDKLLELIPNDEMGYGKIICKCNLVDCVYMDEKFIEEIKKNEQEYLCGGYSEGRYAWVLANIEVLKNPIEAKGNLRIWNHR